MLSTSHLTYLNGLCRYQVFRTGALTKDQASFLRRLPYDFWRDAQPDKSAVVMIHPKIIESFKKAMDAHSIYYEVVHEDVEQLS